MIFSLVFFLYRFLIAPLGFLFVLVASLLSPRIRRIVRLRFFGAAGPPWRNLSFGERPLLIHAASGEFEYAKPLIRELKTQFPQLPIVVTYFSDTYQKPITNFPGIDKSFPLPWDLPGPMSSLVRSLKPRAVLISRTDIWPEMLEQCRKAGIPVGVFSLTFSENSNLLKRFLYRFLSKKISLIYTVSEQDKEALSKAVGNASIEVIGDTRYDQVTYRLKNPKPLKEALRPKGLTVVAGSTWRQDEIVLLNAMAEALKAQKLSLVLAPHEPTPSHMEELKVRLQNLGLSYTIYSEAEVFDKHVLLIDKVGILADLYAWGHCAFVGGSFRKSVHSVMEPLAAGLWTWVGPYHHNNREALEFKNLPLNGFQSPVSEAKDEVELKKLIDIAIHRFSDFEPAANTIKHLIRSREGATQRLIQSLETHHWL